MVKAYLRYEPAAAFGVIASINSNISYDSTGKLLLSPALEKIGVWQVRQGVCTKTLAPPATATGPSLAVTSIAPSSSSLVASGYADGSIRIWDLTKGTTETTLNGHKGAVTALRYNKLDSMLASGGNDNDIILWDVVGEAGLFRLRGHRAQVTDLVFVDNGKKLVSSSTDKFLRVWDLDTQHCMQIVSGHHSEVWSIDVDPEERFLVTGSKDPELRFYTMLKHEDGLVLSNSQGNETANGEKVSLPQSNWEVLKHFGEIQRQSKDRVVSLRFNKSGNLLACQVKGKMVEIFRVLDDDESKRKAKRRVHRKKEKSNKKKSEDGDADQGAHEEENVMSIAVSDVFKLLQTLRASKKICSTSFCPTTSKGALATLALSLNNNTVEIYSVSSESTNKTHDIELPGHRSDIRSLSLSSDNSLLLSTSHNAVKIWNPSTCSCLHTIDSGYGLCSMFVPGVANNKYALVGTKEGNIEIFDIKSGDQLEIVKAHGGALHSITALPDGSGFVTGSADHDVKFWEYDSGKDSKNFTVSNKRTMKMNDDVLKVVISPDAKYFAVALLDCTVKVHFLDSLKFFLSLYGHKLPVLCMDVSADGDLIVTGSADKNLKIWGLDFGDCHKSLFAHAESVMDVKFVGNTHYMFSVGKDKLVKYWDADKFELLLTLEGHHAEVWCLAVSQRGDFIVTGSHDRSLRRWDRTEEPMYLEEEKEKRLEEKFESDLDGDSQYAPREDIPDEGAVAVAGKNTKETLSAADSILEALDMAEVEVKRIAEHEKEKRNGNAAAFQPNILMLGFSPSDFVLRALSSVHTNDLEQTLLAMPFSDALKLLPYLESWTSNRDKVELICRVSTVILQTHYSQLISTPSARPALTILKDSLHARVKECKDTLGFNLAAMDHLKQLMAMQSDAPFRDAKTKLLEIRTKLAKRMDPRRETQVEKKKKKRQKKESISHGHAWT